MRCLSGVRVIAPGSDGTTSESAALSERKSGWYTGSGSAMLISS